jgi:peroxiredoxin
MLRRGLVLLALIAGCAAPTASGAGAQSAAGAAGDSASDFTLRDVDGRTVRLSDYSGQVVLLDFWATWCQPCKVELPHLQELYRQNQGRGFVVLGISMDGPESVASVVSDVRRLGIEFPMLLDEETRVTGIYNPKRTAPLSVLIDRGGRIARVRQGYNPGDETLVAADVQAALK